MNSGTRPLRIFVVENDPDTSHYFKLFLEQMGHVVETSGSVAGALQMLAPDSHDVLIADIGLLDGTGWDLIERLHERGLCPPFAVAMSGFGSARDIERSIACGFRHHLVKPLNSARLREVLDEAARTIDADAA